MLRRMKGSVPTLAMQWLTWDFNSHTHTLNSRATSPSYRAKNPSLTTNINNSLRNICDASDWSVAPPALWGKWQSEGARSLSSARADWETPSRSPERKGCNRPWPSAARSHKTRVCMSECVRDWFTFTRLQSSLQFRQLQLFKWLVVARPQLEASLETQTALRWHAGSYIFQLVPPLCLISM